MIHVIATIEIDPAKREDFLKIFAKLMPKVHAEEGCIAYESTVDVPTDIGEQELVGDGAVIIVEQWSSIEALKAHGAAPHMLAFREEVKEIVRNISLQILRAAPV